MRRHLRRARIERAKKNTAEGTTHTKKVIIAAILALAVAAATVGTASADPRISAAAAVNSDRSVSAAWNVPAGSFGGVFCTSTSSLTDFTGELACQIPTLSYDLLQTGWTTFRTLPLDMSITKPTTIYAQVQLIDPFGDGSCTQGDFATDCDSQVIQLTVNPICQNVLVKAGYTTRSLVRRGHWLRRHGRYVKRHGHRVWVKAVYRTVSHPAVYQTECH